MKISFEHQAGPLVILDRGKVQAARRLNTDPSAAILEVFFRGPEIEMCRLESLLNRECELSVTIEEKS